MILEIAQFQIKAGTESDFEAAVAKAAPLFKRARGCHAMRLLRSIENPSHFTLEVKWETVENHMVDFRESADFAEWRKLVGDYFATAPNVGHVSVAVEGF
ncbi:antibiotic biosynthesis monooxygenase family protein [Cupriavidus basilensis]|uniref:antibiotic biosynthesis monooxygenase family protein n=1 Tax=Cupriavidus basilensis TaxID=68895 RepID=UPI0020A67046|nr:antibiotic biosynthesis monooxygenase family protein [Cupriavidus basilensis]MCP3019085.1 antibiotic biosynthesis monooxygenase [Cupriavidus basilensis]MDR3385280.1 antibiotic biosynthesis monooxygenase [Cupriavidus basilensis]